MSDYTAYWGATCVRGAISLIACVGIAVCAALNNTRLLMPLGIVLYPLILATYVVADSAIVLATSFMLPHHHQGRIALRLQGLVGTVISITCLALCQAEGDIRWFLCLGALQAGCVAIAEFLTAKDTAEYHNSKWCYTAGAISALSCMVLILFHQAKGQLASWVLHSYLLSFGLGLLVLSSHMLFEELHAFYSHGGYAKPH